MTMPKQTIELGGRVITRLGLGTNRIEDNPASRAVLLAAAERGYGLIDNTDIYAGHASETIIGDTLAGHPSGVMIATKGGMRRTPGGSGTDGTAIYLRGRSMPVSAGSRSIQSIFTTSTAPPTGRRSRRAWPRFATPKTRARFD